MDKPLVVSTSTGVVRGFGERGVRAWKGIPYAAPPVGDSRFRHAKPHEGWSGVLDATSYGPACSQDTGRREIPMSEDCLTLNIWASDTDTAKKPVLVFLHGGSFCRGSGSDSDLNGAALAAAGDAVVLTMNYRLGVLGFLDFGEIDQSFDANCGISDVLEALRWVHENIEGFGGDPANVTLFGQSAGAIVTSLLPVMPAAEGLAARGIMMSGGPTLPMTKAEVQALSSRFLDFMEIGKDELMSMDAKALTERTREFSSFCGLGAGTFLPEIDGTLVEDYPVAAAAAGRARPVSLLIGTTREEMSFLEVKPVAKALDIAGIMDAGVDGESEEVRDHIAAGYERYGKRKTAILISDLVFRMGSVWLAETMSALTDVWMYRFDYETPAMKVSKLHAFHSSDVPFVFGNHKDGMAPLMFLFSPSKRTIREITREMQTDFITFAREGRLPWDKCDGIHTPAKCYKAPSTIEPAVEPDIKERYLGSNYHKRSFGGLSNNLHS